MTKLTDIVRSLRAPIETPTPVGKIVVSTDTVQRIMAEAANEIERLRTALKPLAYAGGSKSANHNDLHGALSTISMDDLRFAHGALEHNVERDVKGEK